MKTNSAGSGQRGCRHWALVCPACPMEEKAWGPRHGGLWGEGTGLSWESGLPLLSS